MGISQSAVSQSILKLESELGLTLFVREHGRMRPTETAFTLYEESSRAFDGLDRVFNLARDLRGFQRGQLRLAVPYSVASSYLPKALKQIARQQPKLRFAIKLGNYQRIIGWVAAREVDLGIAKLPIMVPGVESVPICSSKLVAVIRTSANFGNQTSREKLKDRLSRHDRWRLDRLGERKNVEVFPLCGGGKDQAGGIAQGLRCGHVRFPSMSAETGMFGFNERRPNH